MTQRIKLIVELDLDPRPGRFYTAGSAHEAVHHILMDELSAYDPSVNFGGYVPRYYEIQAILIRREHMDTGARIRVGDRAPEGWYYVRYDDPAVLDLWLPPKIFYKCFKFPNEDHRYYSKNFSFVEEI